MKITGTRAEVEAKVAEADAAAGLPRPPDMAGSAVAHLVPQRFAPGAFGWTQTTCEITFAGELASADVPEKGVSDVGDSGSEEAVRSNTG
jgi:hypothetical protein